MVTRQRDLDAFVWADPRDVRLVDCGAGLQFVLIGCVPARRFLLESMYGLLTLKNGVPIGYALASGLMQYAEVAYNVFETFRGGEAAFVYGRLLATMRWLFDARAYTIHPYQLGDGNDEGLDSGAWWFYYKLGFRPRARRAKALVAREVARIARIPRIGRRAGRSRTSSVIVSTGHHRRSPQRARRATASRPHRTCRSRVRCRSDSATDRERAVAGVRGRGGDAAGRRALEATRCPANEWRGRAGPRWSPSCQALPEWPAADRRELADVIRAKGGRYESDYVRKFDAHARLRSAVVALSRGTTSSRFDSQGRSHHPRT